MNASLAPRLRLLNRASFREPLRALQQRAALVLLCVFVVVTTLILSAEQLFRGVEPAQYSIGGIVAEDIIAPQSITYTSDILTQQRREAAANSIVTLYNPVDTGVAREQVARLQNALDAVDTIRLEPDADEKRATLETWPTVRLTSTQIETVINLLDASWQLARVEASGVLERVLRESIREEDVASVISGLPSEVSIRFSQETADLIAGIADDFIRPNRFPNDAATESARQAAIDAVVPEARRFEQGQVIVRAGTRIDALDYEAMQQVGVLGETEKGGEGFFRSALLALLVGAGITIYIRRTHPDYGRDMRSLWVLTAIYIFLLIAARIFATNDAVTLFPAAALALLCVSLFAVDFAVFIGFMFAFLLGASGNASPVMSGIIALGGVAGPLALRYVERVNRYFVAGMIIALINLAGLLLLDTTLLQNGLTREAWLAMAVALGNGVVTAMVTLAGLYLISVVFNLPTSLKLVELSQPNQPLLQRLLREAPGTYQHSLQVANLAEQAASAIGANAELVRVAALYHDIGKVLNPVFFVENQADGVNPHDVLNDPYRSADIIISHVPDGDRLARQYRLPARLRDFILEHHGKTRVSYFYTRALTQASEPNSIDAAPFTYPGPKPQTRETAVLMLADSCESTVRARKPGNRNEIAEIVEQIFDNRIEDGQLDECPLTLHDLHRAEQVFVDMLQGVFHPRINYPAIETRRRTLEIGQAAPIPSIATGAPPLAANGKAGAVRKTGEIEKAAAVSVPAAISDDDAPLAEVPPLRRPRPSDTSTVIAVAATNGNGQHEIVTDTANSAKETPDGAGQPTPPLSN